MKFILAILVITSGIMNVAKADVIPPSGTTYTAELTDSTTASILYDSIEGAEQSLPSGIESWKPAPEMAAVTKAKVKVTINRSNKVTIACFQAYYRGHHNYCKLVQQF